MNTVITIGRQFGSGGRETHFGIKCYDKGAVIQSRQGQRILRRDD